MFKCDTCGKITGTGASCYLTPVKIRRKVYSLVNGVEVSDSNVKEGYETVRMEKKCLSCFKKWEDSRKG